MKIVLRENVENLGRRGDIVDVASGYGRNFLIPKKLAYLDTPGFRKMLAAERRGEGGRGVGGGQEGQAGGGGERGGGCVRPEEGGGGGEPAAGGWGPEV